PTGTCTGGPSGRPIERRPPAELDRAVPVTRVEDDVVRAWLEQPPHAVVREESELARGAADTHPPAGGVGVDHQRLALPQGPFPRHVPARADDARLVARPVDDSGPRCGGVPGVERVDHLRRTWRAEVVRVVAWEREPLRRRR